jgi:hypothetical protein
MKVVDRLLVKRESTRNLDAKLSLHSLKVDIRK